MASQNHTINIIVQGKDQASGPLGKVKGALGGMAQIAGGIIGAQVLGKLAEGIRGIGDAVIDAAPVEGLRMAFEGFATASGQASDALLGDLNRASMGMVAQRDLMKSYNMATQLVGQSFANTLPDAMQHLTKVSAATGEDMGFMMDSLVRGVGRLSPMILDNLGIQVSLTEAYDKFADANGLVASEMTKGEQQAALMAEVMSKLETNTAALPSVAGTAAQGIAAFKAQVQNAKDEIGTAFLPVLNGMLDSFMELWAEHGPQVIAFFRDHLAPAIGTVASFITSNLMPAVEGAGGFFQGLMAKVQPVIDWFQNNIVPAFQPVIDAFQAVLPPVLAAFGDLWTNVLQPAIQGFVGFLETSVLPLVSALASLIGTALGVAVRVLAGLFTNKIVPALKTFKDWIGPKLTPAFDAIKKAIQWVIDKINKLREALASLSIPKALMPGSPTPFEIGLRGIGSSMQNLSRRDIPTLGREMMALERGGQNIDNRTTNIMPVGQQVINNQVDSDTVMSQFLTAARRS